MDLSLEQKALSIAQDVALRTTLDLLASIVAALFSSHTGAFDRLAIDHAGARLGISLLAHPHTLVQGGVNPLPGAVEPLSPEVMVDGLPGREVVR
jgi:hypothetical protein